MFRPKASDMRGAARLDPLTGHGRHARRAARDGRGAWERTTGYGRRNAAEWIPSRLNRVLGAGLRSRSLDAQRGEASIAVLALDRMAGLGTPRASRARRMLRRLGNGRHEPMRPDASKPMPAKHEFGAMRGRRLQ